jgi:tetratricopeptide (TPR) repeat protein
MKRLMMMLIVVSLLIGVAPLGWSSPASDAAQKNKMDAAKKLEEKGDLARIHENYASAASCYESALRVLRQDSALYNKLGVVYLEMKDNRLARKSFAQAHKFDPQLIPAINNLGAVALIDKNYKQAAEYFKQALAMDEPVAATHLNLAEAWMGMKEVDRAMAEYARALELDADILNGNQEGTIAQVSTPEQRARIAFMVAKSYAKRGNIDGALESLRRAKELRYPDLAKVYTDPDFAPLLKDPRLAKIVKP